MSFIDLAKKRFSARDFSNKKILKEYLIKILEAGRVAPTAANKQPQRVLVIESEEGLLKISKATRVYNAPTVLIICTNKDEAWERNYDKHRSLEIDATIVTDHMMLMATDLGINSLWITWFNPEILREEFRIPENLQIVNILALGYQKGKIEASDRHSNSRKSFSDTILYENF